MSTDSLIGLALSQSPGIGPVRFTQLCDHFGSAKKIWEAPLPECIEILGQKTGEAFFNHKKKIDLIALHESVVQKDVQYVSFFDPQYPDSIRSISDPPTCLYFRGDSNLLSENNLFGVVGTRSPTQYGKAVCKTIAGGLTKSGWTIVSGMALGIDSIAHYEALNEKGKTIAVLGCGVDIIYPPGNRPLYERIIREGGLVVSEFSPGTIVSRGTFISRNRIISALSRGVIVIEGTSKSGSLATARYAAVQGRDVFAIPGPITSTLSEAPNILLKEGAVPVTGVEDILSYYGAVPIPKLNRDIEEKYLSIVQILQQTPRSINDLSVQTRLSLEIISNLLSEMELEGIVERASDGIYYLVF